MTILKVECSITDVARVNITVVNVKFYFEEEVGVS